MLKKLSELIAQFRTNRELKRRVPISALILAIFRLVAHIPVPGVNTAAIKSVFASNQLLF